MIEVEAKVKIPNEKEYRKKIKTFGEFKGIEKKTDDYYSLESPKRYPRKSLRVRKKNKTYEINFKEKLSYVKGVHAKNEQEFQVDDIKDFLSLINDFGFKKWLTKIKTTELYEIRKNFHIELNHVKNLGWFLEIEYLTSKNNIRSARKQVLQVIRKLGLKNKDIVKQGYTKMLWNKGFYYK